MCRLGVLCNDITDALEGLPRYLGRDIRVVLTEDHVELSSDYLDLLRAVQRNWLMAPTRGIIQTPPLGIRREGHKWVPALKELEYARWCYHRLVLGRDQTQKDVLAEAQTALIHPRTGRAPRDLSTLQHAANTYHDSLVLVRMNKELPRWIRLARKKGFFNEDVNEIAAARASRR